ncbi:MAG: hypothetical protein R3247_14050 [Rhodothermales bacterium]|nr:hypothetical protein [Rhodothermales bacterium]
MTVQEYMLKHARALAGGLAWSLHVFKHGQRFSSGQMIDTAVDIAWTHLLPRAATPQELVIERRFNMILFRAKPFTGTRIRARAA